ncbi:MAG: radical SAM family heme chaperone HemW [Abditibacteriota bacterium]|nr:radical SAM family heme chaperone HemW [Abditibacteriota bacterium]
MLALYIHIPFCLRKCNYCDFFSVTTLNDWEERYVDSLCKSISNKELFDQNKEPIYKLDGKPIIDTIYVGGGTPSLLSEKSFDRIFQVLYENFSFDSNIESTLEVNPATVDKEKLLFLRGYFNRLSVGCQSFRDIELSSLGRLHTSEEAIETVETAHKVGFENISIDLMFKIPFQTLDTFKNTLKITQDLPVNHISAYELTFEENTPFWENMTLLKEQINSESDFDKCLGDLTFFKRYEVSNYAKDGYESKHNLNYWHNGEYFGFGAGAVGYIDCVRYKYICDLEKYCDNNELEYIESLGPKGIAFENLMLGLRMTEGFPVGKVTNYLNPIEGEIFLEKVNSLKDYVILENGILRATQRGMDVLNSTILELYTWE